MTTGKSRKAKILIVDDHEFIHDILARVFSFDGFNVFHAYNGREAIEKVDDVEPDLIIMDQMMPVMDGLTATRELRKKYNENLLPIIFFTAKNDKTMLVEVLNAGANDYISKPFEKEELLARVSAHLRIRTLQNNLHKKTRELNKANAQINSLNKELVGANKQLRRKVYDLHNLFDISIKFLSVLDVDDVVNTSLLTILGLFGVKFVSLALKSQDEPSFFTVNSKGIEGDPDLKLKMNVDDPLIRKLIESKKPFVMSTEPDMISEVYSQLKRVNVNIVTPLIFKNELMGLLLVGKLLKEEKEAGSYIEMMGVLGNLISVALSNADLFNQVQSMSYKDGMTGLHNYRFFEMRMNEEFSRAKRETTPLSLLILDVDHFKNYNDTLGHVAGDEVLRQLAGILIRSTRQNDIAARYGGEEFAIILPGIERDNAIKVAQRLRKSVEKTPFPEEYVQPSKRITVSIGMASYPGDGENYKELIENADKALYKAKREGRNKLVIFEKDSM